jgi:squalene synthase HpnC
VVLTNVSKFADAFWHGTGELPIYGKIITKKMTNSEAFAYCKQLAKTHYENFHVASFFLPKQLRQPFHIVYAYCRCSDDIADEHNGSPESRHSALQKLDDWQRQLDQCFEQSPPDAETHPVFIALRSLIQQYTLPKEPFDDLLIAFRQDQTKQTYATFDELLNYCRYSANPVGRIVLHLAGTPLPEQLTWSDSICTALQLANFWQDVSRDKAMGRCYIPLDVAQRFGVNPADLHDSPEFRRMMQELVADARNRFQSGKPLIESVPRVLRSDISLIYRGGLAILDAIERIRFHVLEKRPALSRWTKIRLLLETLILGRRT